MDVFLDRSRSMPNIRRMTSVFTDNVHEAVSSVALTARTAGHETRQGCIEFVPIIRDAASSGIEAVHSVASSVIERSRHIPEYLSSLQQFLLSLFSSVSHYIGSFWHRRSDQASSPQ
ncbi:hypothetical protein Zmor_019804 [Zophobas morio]|uniref:Uncharacterized protein n=1 Tax=Zophobas morio TaxID=2755281 RepID=A0AA38M9T3_9CUCU|nr:hypothetical protein Zmor_019804 [Zophobas morio]